MHICTAGPSMVKYSKGYKFLLRESVSVACDIPISCGIDKYITLDAGVLTIHAGYAWDGASGPVVDTVNSIRATLVHDAVYQLMREMVLHIVIVHTVIVYFIHCYLRMVCHGYVRGIGTCSQTVWFNVC